MVFVIMVLLMMILSPLAAASDVTVVNLGRGAIKTYATKTHQGSGGGVRHPLTLVNNKDGDGSLNIITEALLWETWESDASDDSSHGGRVCEATINDRHLIGDDLVFLGNGLDISLSGVVDMEMSANCQVKINGPVSPQDVDFLKEVNLCPLEMRLTREHEGGMRVIGNDTKVEVASFKGGSYAPQCSLILRSTGIQTPAIAQGRGGVVRCFVEQGEQGMGHEVPCAPNP